MPTSHVKARACCCQGPTVQNDVKWSTAGGLPAPAVVGSLAGSNSIRAGVLHPRQVGGTPARGHRNSSCTPVPALENRRNVAATNGTGVTDGFIRQLPVIDEHRLGAS